MKFEELLDAFPDTPPPPTTEDPFIQVEWVVAQRAMQVPTPSGRENYRNALRYHLQFLAQSRGRSPATLRELWTVTTLIEFKRFLLEQTSLLSHSRVGVVSCLRASMREAVVLQLLPEFANAMMPAAKRETQTRKVYSGTELAAVLEVIRIEHQFTMAVLRGYVSTGEGRHPKATAPHGQRGTHPARAGYGWKVPANMRWYFENVLDCVPVQGGTTEGKKHRTFLHRAGLNHGGIRELYRSWGVTMRVDGYVLGPLVLQLQFLTGLNPFSLITLRADCMGQHRLLKTTYLNYRKMRSQGDMQLLLDLLNGVRNSLDVGDYVEDRVSLQREQAVLIERCIGRILKLTEGIRARADPELAKFLFIYESPGPKAMGEILHFDLGKVNQWCHRQVDAQNLKADDGTRLSFNLVRFRPTRLTEMAKQGKDYFEIQQYAGHEDILTTIDYIDEHTFESLADKETSRTLETIWSNKREFEATELAAPETSTDSEAPAQPYQTLMAKCKDVFKPPEHVRKLFDYQEGKGCPRQDMCLHCDNILVTESDLPLLAYHRGQVQRALSPESSTSLPHRKLYEKTLSVLNGVFDYEKSEFTPEQLDRAIEMAMDEDMVLDWLVYVATEDAQ